MNMLQLHTSRTEAGQTELTLVLSILQEQRCTDREPGVVRSRWHVHMRVSAPHSLVGEHVQRAAPGKDDAVRGAVLILLFEYFPKRVDLTEHSLCKHLLGCGCQVITMLFVRHVEPK